MMEGIEILSIGEIGINPVFNWTAAIIGGILIGLIPAFYAGIEGDSIKDFIVVLLLCALFFGAICGFSAKNMLIPPQLIRLLLAIQLALMSFIISMKFWNKMVRFLL